MSPRPTRSRPTRRLLRPIAIAVVVLQLAACGTAVQTSSPSAPPTASPSSASSSIAPGSPAPSSSPADVSSTFAAIEQDVQAIRELSLRQPVEPTITDEAGITAQRAVYTTALAQRGITGPLGLFEGPNGLCQLFDQSIDLNLSNSSLDVVEQTGRSR